MIIVSGSPRSGTSVMMRILSDSGYQTVSDEPGSYESKDLLADITLLEKVPPKDRDMTAVKIFYPTVLDLPERYVMGLKVIWMTRNHKECAKSQKKYYETRLKSPKPRSFVGERSKSIRKINKMAPDVLRGYYPVLIVSFDQLVTHPRRYIAPLDQFLHGEVPTPVDVSCVFTRDPANDNNMPVGKLELMEAP